MAHAGDKALPMAKDDGPPPKVDLVDEEGEEEEPMEEDDEVELLPFESSFLRECAQCHARSYLRKGGCCNPMCDTVVGCLIRFQRTRVFLSAFCRLFIFPIHTR